MLIDEIVAHKRKEIEKRRARIPLADYKTRAESTPEARDFAGALGGEYVALIAEIKGASPGYGVIRREYETVRIAQTYTENGASAISVATDRKYCGGEPNNMKAGRVGTLLPILRNDFIIDEYQVHESRAWQADAILLRADLLDDAQLRAFRMLAESLGMSALVQVRDERELERALKSDARVIVINNRNFANLSVDLATTERLASLIAPSRIVVSASGISSRASRVRTLTQCSSGKP